MARRPKPYSYLDHFARRLIEDAICSALPRYYERRAQELVAVGTRRCDEAAQACLNAAEFWRRYGSEILPTELEDQITIALAEAAAQRRAA